MKVKDFFETEDEFTKEDFETLLYILDITKDSLCNTIKDLIDSISDCDCEDLKTIDIEYNKLVNMRRICTKFYWLIDRNLTIKEWGKYLKWNVKEILFLKH